MTKLAREKLDPDLGWVLICELYIGWFFADVMPDHLPAIGWTVGAVVVFSLIKWKP